MPPDAQRPLRILVIHYRYIGDTVLVVPFFRNLRAAYPHAHIVWALGPGDSEVIKGIPYVDEFLVWDPKQRRNGRVAEHGKLSQKIRFVLKLRRRRFDKVYVLKRSVSSALLGFSVGARERIGFDTEHRGVLLTRRVTYRRDQHEVENLLDVLRADGIPTLENQLQLWVSPDERTVAADFLAAHGLHTADNIVGFHPYSTKAPRSWHEDDFAEVGNKLHRTHGTRVIIFGSKQDEADAERLCLKMKGVAVNAAGKTNLRGTIALLARCRLLVCNDSGIMHLGAALDIPVVGLFGPGSPLRFGPWTQKARVVYHSFPCSPCRQEFFRDCQPSARKKPPCIEAISVRQVLDAIDGLRVFPPINA